MVSTNQQQTTRPSVAPAQAASIASVLARSLFALDVREAFGIVGGGIAPVAEALQMHGIAVYHVKHEAGAAFAATESSLASGRPVVVFVTLGPGLTNAITGILAARSEGARIVVLSGLTAPTSRGRFALQETTPQTLPAALFTAGGVFDVAEVVESAAQLPVALASIAHGLAGPAGFVGHVAMAASTAVTGVAPARPIEAPVVSAPTAPSSVVDAVAERIASNPFFVWAGFGARDASVALRELVALTGAPVVASPRGKGIFPEDHPAYAGVSGLGGHARVRAVLRDLRPEYALVLGTRLGEFTSFWRDELVPRREVIHVDVDRRVFGRAYPEARTLGVHADVGDFLRRLVARLRVRSDVAVSQLVTPAPVRGGPQLPREGSIRSSFLFDEVQRVVIDASDALVCGFHAT